MVQAVDGSSSLVEADADADGGGRDAIGSPFQHGVVVVGAAAVVVPPRCVYQTVIHASYYIEHDVSTLATNRRMGDSRGMSDMARFGKLIVEARSRRGWTVRQAGEALGREPSYLSRLENARNANPPSASEFREILKGLGISPVEGLLALGYLTEADVEAAGMPVRAASAAVPPRIEEALAAIDWADARTVEGVAFFLGSLAVDRDRERD